MFEKGMLGFDINEKVFFFPKFRNSTGECADGVNEIGRFVVCSARFAVIAVLFRLVTFRTGAFDESVGEKCLGFGIEKLFDLFFFNAVGFSESSPNFMAQCLVFGGVCTAIVFKFDVEAVEVVQMGGVHRGDEVFLGDALGTGAEHNGRAVSIVGTDIDAVIASQFLESHPNVGLNVFDKMTNVDMSIGIRQCGGNDNFTRHNREREVMDVTLVINVTLCERMSRLPNAMGVSKFAGVFGNVQMAVCSFTLLAGTPAPTGRSDVAYVNDLTNVRR